MHAWWGCATIEWANDSSVYAVTCECSDVYSFVNVLKFAFDCMHIDLCLFI